MLAKTNAAPFRYEFYIHRGTDSRAGLVDMTTKIGHAKVTARSRSKKEPGFRFSVFRVETGKCVAVFLNGEPLVPALW